MFEPIIKWSGSKRSQAGEIIKFFPDEINTYYEPFCGGASVLYRLLNSDKKVKEYVCSDLNSGLIDLWNEIIKNPDSVSSHYKSLWTELNKDSDIARKKEYYESIRKRYNEEHNPLDFMFIMRTAVNGMPRYNKNGLFNTSFHLSRNGINPDRLDDIIHQWSQLLNNKNVRFKCCSYDEINPAFSDFLYLDPPYSNAKGMYYGTIEYDKFWDYLRNVPCSYALSFDGISGNKDNTKVIPQDIFDSHQYINAGNSSFKRVVGNSTDAIVKESLYVKSASKTPEDNNALK